MRKYFSKGFAALLVFRVDFTGENIYLEWGGGGAERGGDGDET